VKSDAAPIIRRFIDFTSDKTELQIMQRIVCAVVRTHYYAADGKLMAAPVRSGESFEVGAPVSLFEFRAGTFLVGIAPYAVTGDGQRFLLSAVVETEPNAPLTVIVNWPAEVKR
jgi:hypothetical protein